MSDRPGETFHDRLITPSDPAERPEGYFDRFVFNLHARDGATPSILLGHGLRPGRDAVEGFAIASTGTRQQNLRWADRLSATNWSSCGPFSFEVVEPNSTWRIRLQDNPTGLGLDLLWRARTPAWWGEIEVVNATGGLTSFQHLFQSGHVEGSLTLDGEQRSVDGWYSQRDRSRGVRTMSGGQGLHVWFQAQFPDRSVGFLLVETRTGERILLEGAVMLTDGRLDPVVDVVHDLVFDADLDLRSGLVRVLTAGGETYDLRTDASARGGYLAGGGYGGHQGETSETLEHDVYPLDGTLTPRTLVSSLTDRLATFDWDGVPGCGIFEFALSRSRSYVYRPTLGAGLRSAARP